MNIFAISDLHLSLAAPFNKEAPDLTPLYKPMNVFGARWDDALSRLTSNWQEKVTAAGCCFNTWGYFLGYDCG